MNRRHRLILPATVLGLALTAGCANAEQPRATTVPTTVTLTQVATLDQPTDLVARAGTTRMYASEKAGRIWALDPRGGQLERGDRPLLDISEAVNDADGERGLLGLAFSPDGSQLFANYTDGNDNGATVIASWPIATTSGVDAVPVDAIDAGRRTEVLRVAQPFPNHNGGNLTFGPDGFLYIGFGDGGSQGDPNGNGQNPNTLLAAMLRIDPLHRSENRPYSIPADNPFAGGTGANGGAGRPEVFAYGLRNPWRFSFDRTNGDLWIGDVGGESWEEIDHLPATSGGGRGANLGWSLREGRHDTDKAGARPADLVEPVYEYDHDHGSSVTGGFVYRGSKLTGLSGTYLFTDFAQSSLRTLRMGADGTVSAGELRTAGATPEAIASFGQDNAGEIYLVSLSGPILRLDPQR